MRKNLLKTLQKYKNIINISLTIDHLKEVKNIIHEKNIKGRRIKQIRILINFTRNYKNATEFYTRIYAYTIRLTRFLFIFISRK